jgi:two-component system, OmpR family, sensor histidine kinase BaeS
MNRWLAMWLTALALVVVVLADVLLRPPTAGERAHLALILLAPIVAAAVLVPVLSRWVSRRTSVAGAALFVGLCSLGLGAVTTSAASNAMFLKGHDYRLFLVVLLLSCGIALVVGAQLTRPLASDIRRLGEVASRVAGGDLTALTGIDRRDEVGKTAVAVDTMVTALAEAAHERSRHATARQQLFSSLGHDLRTPLAAMRAAVESLQDGVAPDPRRYLAILAGQVDSIEAMLDQLIEYARIESGHTGASRETVSLSELADEAIEAMTPVAHRFGVHLALAAEQPGFVTANNVELSRVLRNLIENAVRHSPTGGTIRLTVTEGNAVELRVQDEGMGFPDEFRQRAFQPFTRADVSRNGRTGHAGLGLAITHGIVAAHGGRSWIGDGPGGDVHLSLPNCPLSPVIHPTKELS